MNRILFVESYPHAFFGQQKTLLSLLDSRPGSDCEPVIAVPGDGIFLDKVRSRGLQIEIFPYPNLIAGYGGAIYDIRGLRRLIMLMQTILYIFSIRKRLKGMSISGVFCNDMRGLLTIGVAARSLRLPVLIWDKLDKKHGLLDSFQLLIASKNIVISKAVLKKYPSWQIKLFSEKIKEITDGVVLESFNESRSIRHELMLDENAIVLAIIGAITERKGHDRVFLIWDALLKKIPDINLLVVGESLSNASDELYYDDLKAKGLSGIHFLGTRHDIPNIMKSIDILLVPSRSEGMGLVILEAMASYIPVIGSRAGGIPEVIVDGETGLIFDGDDQQQLIDKIIYLAKSPDIRKSMGRVGRMRVEKLYNQKSKMIEVWNCLLS